MDRVDKQGIGHQQVPGMGIRRAVCMEKRAGKVLKPCQLHQGALVSTWQKTTASLSSVPTMAHAAPQTEHQ